jgi:transcriptional regulator with XRE-family HTH domain
MFHLEQETMTTPDQIRAARALVGLSQPAVAASAGVSAMTVKRAEGSSSPPASAEAVAAIRAALEASGVVFLPENGNGPGVALRRSKSTFKRLPG